MRRVVRVIITGVCLLVGVAVELAAQTQIDLDKIDRFIKFKHNQTSIPGIAVAIVHQGEVVFKRGYGTSSDGSQITGDTPFAIASLSKSFTAMAVMQLVEAGSIKLDSSATHYLPSLRLKDSRFRKISVRHLLHQTSGMSDRLFPEMEFGEQPSTLSEAIARFETVELADAPGEKYHYHNPNYQVLAMLVEAVSKEKFTDYLQRHIFQPLRMNNTSSVSQTERFYDDQAAGVPLGHAFMFAQPIKMKELSWFVEGAAGMISTANDMAHWLSLQLNDGAFRNTRLLSKDGIRIMHEPPTGVSSQYGMGWITGKNTIYHAGILWTYQAEQIVMKDEGFGIVILFNSGLNAFVDYSSFGQGISAILRGQTPDDSDLSKLYVVIIGCFIIITIFMGVRRILRSKEWVDRHKGDSRWKLSFLFLVRLFPLGIFICIPYLFYLLDRVLSWERIFWMMPEVILWLGLAALFSLIIVTLRFIKIYSRMFREALK